MLLVSITTVTINATIAIVATPRPINNGVFDELGALAGGAH